MIHHLAAVTMTERQNEVNVYKTFARKGLKLRKTTKPSLKKTTKNERKMNGIIRTKMKKEETHRDRTWEELLSCKTGSSVEPEMFRVPGDLCVLHKLPAAFSQGLAQSTTPSCHKTSQRSSARSEQPLLFICSWQLTSGCMQMCGLIRPPSCLCCPRVSPMCGYTTGVLGHGLEISLVFRTSQNPPQTKHLLLIGPGRAPYCAAWMKRAAWR